MSSHKLLVTTRTGTSLVASCVGQRFLLPLVRLVTLALVSRSFLLLLVRTCRTASKAPTSFLLPLVTLVTTIRHFVFYKLLGTTSK